MVPAIGLLFRGLATKSFEERLDINKFDPFGLVWDALVVQCNSVLWIVIFRTYILRYWPRYELT